MRRPNRGVAWDAWGLDWKECQGLRPWNATSRFSSAYVAPDVAHRLRVLAAVEDTSTQALIEQAIEMLFQSRRSG